ncbi:MAG: hypothetical protein ABI460_15130 [Caldimonas sp.]
MTTAFAAPRLASRPALARDAAPRLDLYASIHKALRACMADTLVRIGRIDVADAGDRDEALAQLEQLLMFCSDHVRHENTFVHTAIEARQPAGASRIAEEHVEHLESIAALREEAAALGSAAADIAPALALRLYRHLALFVAENFQHMQVEESMHNALLWQHYSDAELAALHGRLMASLSPQDKLMTMRWMMPASTPGERAMMVAGLKAEMPPEALLGVMTMLRPHLDARGWAKLARAAGVTPSIAG